MVLLPVMLVNVCKVEVGCVEVRGVIEVFGGEVVSVYVVKS